VVLQTGQIGKTQIENLYLVLLCELKHALWIGHEKTPIGNFGKLMLKLASNPGKA
jgi:hypothetical protein